MKNKIILVLTNSDDATSDYLCNKLLDSGASFLRFDTDKDIKDTSRYEFSESQHYIKWNGQLAKPEDISAIVYRRPKPITLSNMYDEYYSHHLELEWSEVLEGFLSHIPVERWINHPSLNYMASHKIEQLSRAKQHGLATPKSIVTNQQHLAHKFVNDLEGSVIVKPLSSGYIERDNSEDDTLIYTNDFSLSNLKLLEKIDKCPVLFQEKIEKLVDVRVTVIDKEVIAIGMKSLTNTRKQILDIRRNNMKNVIYSKILIPKDIKKSIRSLMKCYKLRFGALDFAITPDEKWIFFEINPNGQWAWLDQIADAKISDSYIKSLKCT